MYHSRWYIEQKLHKYLKQGIDVAIENYKSVFSVNVVFDSRSVIDWEKDSENLVRGQFYSFTLTTLIYVHGLNE